MGERITVRITAHAVERAMEKFGLEPTDEQWQAAAEAIMHGRSVLMHTNPSGCETHLVEFCGIAVKMVVDPQKPSIVTLLRQSEGNKFVRRVRAQRLKGIPRAERRQRNRNWLVSE